MSAVGQAGCSAGWPGFAARRFRQDSIAGMPMPMPTRAMLPGSGTAMTLIVSVFSGFCTIKVSRLT